ncbi:hypothetical protein SGCZBJ_03860 [Caulobacter zeae]|uniref:Uncharacterized protein n=1 Tax=Caulobacter zeae TaxID=2055137 RepID=A0A2N5DQ14_9CAUL|nr:hypothetical protein [Caulobacter zeae]PLR28153.1 hypothetical protein SGCZBJ_03860 [Caulobacter zeae]
MVDYGGDLTPYLGGPVQRIERLGSRFALAVELPKLDQEEARVWVSRLLQAKRSSGVLGWPQLGNGVGDEGAPRVNGAGQGGTVLSLDGLPPNKAIKEGWFFSLNAGGRRYLHMITADAVASNLGAVTVTIEPMLRIVPPDNAVIELAAPKIEGLVQGNEGAWEPDLAEEVGLSFTLVERE